MLLLYIVLIPTVIFGTISILTRKYRNPWRLYLVFGKKGSGKSTYLVKTGLRYLKKGFSVYTNMDDFIYDGIRHINIDQLGDFVPVRNSVLLIDEAGMIWDNRNFKSFKPSVRDFFKLQRHYHVIVYLASQTFDVDKKLRDLCDGMYLHSCLFNVFSLGRRIYKSIKLTEPESDRESKIAEALKFAPIWNWTFTYIPKYSKYYKSFQVPDLPEIPYD